MPKLRQLEYLVALADARTFREAASITHVSQPTLSQQIKTLENRLGTPLIQRGTFPVELTPVGRDIVRRARKILLEIADIRKLGKAGEEAVAGIFKLGISPTLGPYVMPEVVAQLHRDFPDLRLHLVEDTLSPQLAALRRGELDMIVATKEVVGDDLTTLSLFREALHLVAAPDHPLVGKKAIPPADLVGTAMIGLGEGHALQDMIAQLCSIYDLRLEYDYQGSSLDSVCQMVASGLGLGVLPDRYLKSAVGGRNVVRKLQVEGWAAERSIIAVWRKTSASAAPLELAHLLQTNTHGR